MRPSTGGIATGLLLGILAAPLAAAAQQPPAKVPRIGYLGPTSYTPHLTEAFRQGLRDIGYVEGQNLLIEWRFAEGRPERLPDLAADLVRLKVDVIVASAPPAPLAAKQATGTIPIVFVVTGDPVAEGLVASLARPGGNVTGMATIAPEVVGKQLELLKEVVPELARVAVLRNPRNHGHPPIVRQAEAAARVLKLQLQIFDATNPGEIDAAFDAMTRQRAGALLVVRDPFLFGRRTQIAAVALKGRLPGMYGIREEAEAGGLMAYGASLPHQFRRAATYVDKILKGAKPADLPVEQPMKFELVLNLKTAKALGLTFPPSILVRADQVIQ